MLSRKALKDVQLRVFVCEADLCKAMANPLLLQLLDLVGNGECVASDLHLAIGISSANLSQHLSVLKNAGFVRLRRSGKHVHVRLANDRVAQACHVLREVLRELMRESRRSTIWRAETAELAPSPAGEPNVTI